MGDAARPVPAVSAFIHRSTQCTGVRRTRTRADRVAEHTHMRDVPALPIQHYSEVRRFGGQERGLPRAVSAGELVRVQRGSYVDSAAWKGLTSEDQHFVRMLAASTAGRGSPVFSHESAAVAWG